MLTSCIFASVGLHASVVVWLAWRAPAEVRMTKPSDAQVFPIDVMDDGEAPPLGVPGGTGHGENVTRRPGATVGAAPHEHVTTSTAAAATSPTSGPGETAEEHKRALREAVEHAMLAPHEGEPGEPGEGTADGKVGGKGKSHSGGVGYLSGWFSSLISVRQLRLTADETSRATALATVTISDGRVQSATLSGPGPVAAYNSAVATALSGLVGRTVPVDSLGDAPSGTFTLRLNPR